MSIDKPRFEKILLPDGTTAYLETLSGEYYFTAKVIAEKLEYGGERPEKQVYKLVDAHKEDFVGLTTVTNLVTVDGKLREVTLYHERAFYKVCIFSTQPKAIPVRDEISKMLQQVRQKGYAMPKISNFKQGIMALRNVSDDIYDKLFLLADDLTETKNILSETKGNVAKLEIQMVEKTEDLEDKMVELTETVRKEVTIEGDPKKTHQIQKKTKTLVKRNLSVNNLDKKSDVGKLFERKCFSTIYGLLKDTFETPTYREILLSQYQDALKWLDALGVLIDKGEIDPINEYYEAAEIKKKMKKLGLWFSDN